MSSVGLIFALKSSTYQSLDGDGRERQWAAKTGHALLNVALPLLLEELQLSFPVTPAPQQSCFPNQQGSRTYGSTAIIQVTCPVTL